MNTLQQHILRTLAYFDIFSYPLKSEEIRLFLGCRESQEKIDSELGIMSLNQSIYKVGHFFALHDNMAMCARRLKGNALAEKEMVNAIKAARLLAAFPYVKGIAVSGSLSKNFCTEKTDIDFFIITAANRLWIARTLMHFYKKFTFLTGKQNWFCMNYYIGIDRPVIEEKNIFTAIEVATLLPMQGKEALITFHNNNNWVSAYLPACQPSLDAVPGIKKGIAAVIVEKLFNNSLGNRVDSWLMNITKKRWEKKTGRNKKNDHGFVMKMMISKYCSKPDPADFQRRVLEQYQEKVESVLKYDKAVIKPGFVA